MKNNGIVILIVDDEHLAARMQQAELERKGYIVHHINNGENAVHTILNDVMAVDLILMDIDLGPGIDGIQAAEKILEHKEIPIVFLSSHNEPEFVEKTEKIASYGYVIKRSGSAALNASIKMALKLFKSRREYKQIEDSLRESENRYRELFENINNGVAVYEVIGAGEDFVFKNYNRAAEKLDNDKRERLIGKSVMEVRPGIKKFGLLDVFRRVWKTGEPERHPLTMYEDNQLKGWYDNYVYKLSSGEIVAVFENVTERKQTEEVIRKQLREKEILLKEVHHRVKNNLSSLIAMLSLQSKSIENEECIAVINESMARVESLKKIYEKLLITDDYAKISLKTYIEDLALSVVDIFPEKDRAVLDMDIADVLLEPKILYPLGSIINELITNSVKHAFSGIENEKIEISVARNGDKIVLRYHDNGPGLPEVSSTGKSCFGLLLVELFAQQLDASIKITNDSGMKCVIEFNI